MAADEISYIKNGKEILKDTADGKSEIKDQEFFKNIKEIVTDKIDEEVVK